MRIREGAIPTALGTVVTGVGAAHMVLGAIDLVEHKKHHRRR